jgi:hypothetical protein
MNEQMTPELQLRAAAQLVERALAQLDSANVACLCCERPTYANRLHSHVHSRLRETPSRLKAAADSLRYEATGDTAPSRGYAESQAAHEERTQR